MKNSILIVLGTILFLSFSTKAQVDQNKIGAWYTYAFNTQLKESQFGFQGDIQYRNWNIIGDLEQLLLRGGVTYSPKKANLKFTLGYGYIASGAFGESDDYSNESRIYQELLLPQKVGSRFYLKHRFRYEERIVESQDFRTRYRYNLFVNVPLNSKGFGPKTIYLALYNEIFINGQRSIGNGKTVEIFDRNRSYIALGYQFTDNLKVQLGVMKQVTDNLNKNQLQFSLHHSF